MSLIRRHETCVGLLLFKFGRRTVELWYCPAKYEIKEHSHPNEEIELMFILGKTTFFRRQTTRMSEDSLTPRWYNMFKTFSVPMGWSHRFTVSSFPLVFLNFAKWRLGVKPTSASVDFELTK